MRRSVLLAGVSLSTLVLTSSLARADGYDRRYVGPPPFSWSGWYIGYHVGGALDKTHVSDPYGSAIYGDHVRSPGPLAGGQIGFNHQVAGTVVGFEADMSWADLDGDNTCFAISGAFYNASCRVHTNWLGSATGRLGLAVGPQGRTLLYAKGGLAWVHKDINMAVNAAQFYGGQPPNATSGSSFGELGWTVGAGVEHALGGHWSAKVEYDYMNFRSHDVATPDAAFGPTSTDGRAAGFSQDVHALKVGVNYRFGAPLASDRGSIKDAPTRYATGTEFEIGARYVHGWGRFQKDLGHVPPQPDPAAVSRLTYEGMRTNGGEIFARLDTLQNVMVKGVLGTGSGGPGKMTDEDFGILIGGFPNPYSNTLQPKIDDSIRYGTVDVGYDVFRGRGYKMASFVGYSYFRQNMDTFGCNNVAGTNCIPAAPANFNGINEHDRWQALRIGAAADFMILPGLKLSGEAAYLPYVKFSGFDDHAPQAAPGTRISDEDGRGVGVQLEATLSYYLSDQFSVGVGGRYLAMWTNSGETNFNNSGTFVDMRFAAEQAAVFAQITYRFGERRGAEPLK